MSIEVYIKNNAKELCDRVYIAPNIVDKKLNNAIESIAKGEDPDYVVAIIDTTLFGSAREGCVIFGDKMYIRPMLGKSVVHKFKYIEEAEYVREEVDKKNDKVEVKEKIILHYENGTRQIIEGLNGVRYNEFSIFINEIVSQVKEGKELKSTLQVLPLANMNEDIKVAYMKLICNFAYNDSNIIRPQEYAEIIYLMVRVGIENDASLEIRRYMNNIRDKEENDDLIKYLSLNLPECIYEILKKSIMKDMLYIKRVKEREGICSYKYIKEIQEKLDIQDSEVEVILSAITNDEDIIKLRMNDSQIKNSIKELVVQAGAVGVPMAAIYFSGSVVGLSTAGIITGLEVLGLGGILGFSSMATGIGALFIMGFATYKGLRKVTNVDDFENSKQRELILQDIIKNYHQSLTYLIEDINEVTRLIDIEVQKYNKSLQKIEKLTTSMSILSKSAQLTINKINSATKEILISKIPKKLDRVRLEELTLEPTKIKLRENILECYDLHEIYGTNNEVIKAEYILNTSLSFNKLEQLLSSFDILGYNNIKDAAIAQVKGFAKGLVNK